MNKTKIEWCDYTWNPVVGCKNACSYCYAHAMNKRFKWIDKWHEPQFFPDRIGELMNSKIKPSKIFVGSMCDLFGNWIPNEWLKQILQAVYDCPNHEFMFLTKNPKRYKNIYFPGNCWIGVTAESGQREYRIKELIKYHHSDVKRFVSIEPLLGPFIDVDLSELDLVIVGAMTGHNAIKPEKYWIDSIRHRNIFYKNNIKKFL